MRDAALLDVVQDYALSRLHEEGIFSLGVVLKGGTALRKFRAGNAGRFSTDLDFFAPDGETADLIFDALDGAVYFDVTIRLVDREKFRAKLVAETPIGRPAIPARVEVSPRPLWLQTVLAAPVRLPVHGGYEFEMPVLPSPALEEALSEKLAAWRRRRKLRDLYDLDFFGRGALNELHVRRLVVLKVWHDVVDDGIGVRPFDPAEIVADFDVSRISEEIGLLAKSVDPRAWLQRVRARYAFVTGLDDVERRLARCNPGDRYEASQLVAALRARAD